MYIIKYRGYMVEREGGGYFFHSMDEVRGRLQRHPNNRPDDYQVFTVQRTEIE